MHPVRSDPVIRTLVVAVMTAFVLTLSAILLPPKGSNAMPRDGRGDAPIASPR